MKKVRVYGIPNCDSTKKAVNLLTSEKSAFTFHDYKQEGISREKLEEWCIKLGWETVFNKKSTTWRALSRAEQEKVINAASAIKIMMQHNSIIKRPVIEIDGKPVNVGFKADEIIKAIK
jgi:arsenate reductase (glutaredoxin)